MSRVQISVVVKARLTAWKFFSMSVYDSEHRTNETEKCTKYKIELQHI